MQSKGRVRPCIPPPRGLGTEAVSDKMPATAMEHHGDEAHMKSCVRHSIRAPTTRRLRTKLRDRSVRRCERLGTDRVAVAQSRVHLEGPAKR